MKKYQIIALLLYLYNSPLRSQQSLTDTTRLSDVIVTAEKRPQSSDRIPASVTTIKGATIEAENARTLRNLSGYAANFYMPEYGSKLTAPVYIRGIGSRINNPAVGLYVDGVPYFDKSVFAFDLSDIERIEILRGPQGTLFGRNTTGGIINVITRAPGQSEDLRVTAGFGNYGLSRYQVMYNQPITDRLAVLVNGSYSDRDGYFTNQYLNSSTGSDFTGSGSIKIRYNPVKPLVVTYKLGGEKSRENGYPYAMLDSADHLGPVSYDHKSFYNRDLIDNNLTAVWYADKFTLTSASSMQYTNDMQNVDQDFTPLDYYVATQAVKQHLYYEEIVLSTHGYRWIDITSGISGFYQKNNRDINVMYGKDYKASPGMSTPKYNLENNKGMAAFGQATARDLFRILDITAGLRYDMEWNSLGYTAYTVKSGTSTLNKDTVFKTSFNQLLPKIALRLKLLPKVSVYAVSSKGYRGGGFNTAYTRAEDETYKAERLWNYETGIKSVLLPGVLSVNIALFYVDLANQQVSQHVTTTGGNLYKNAGKSYSKGVELECQYIPWLNLQLDGNFGYTRARYVDFQPNLFSTVNYKGNDLSMVPACTYAGSVSYKLRLKNKWVQTILFNLSLQGIGKLYWDDANTKSQKQYTLLNAGVSFEGSWFDLQFWSRNVSDTHYYSYAYAFSSTQWFAQAGNPMTMGISFSVRLTKKNSNE